MANTVTFDVVAEVAKATSGLDQVKDKLGGLQSAAGTAGGVMSGMLAADIISKGAAAVSSAIGDTFDTLQQKGVLAAQTEAVLKSTGNAAGVSAEQINAMADAIEGKTLIEDTAIQNGANLMLTFTNVKNAAGEGNDIFNQSIGVMADMAQALGTDTSSAATMLGKALNDPIAGISALGRVGVQLTDEQKNMIKSMVEAGDTMGAQKVILGELNTQFGGSAEAAGSTFAGAMDNLKDTIDGAMEGAIGPLLPMLQDLAEAASDHLPAALEQAQAGIDAITDALAPAADFLGTVIGFMKDNPETVQAFGVTLGILAGVVGIVTAAQWAWNVAMTANPIGLIIVGIAALVAAIVYVATHWDSIKAKVFEVVDGMGAKVGEFVGGVKNWFGDAVLAAANTFNALPGRVWEILSRIPAMAFDIGRDIVLGIVNGIGNFHSSLINAAANLARGALDSIKRTFGIASPSREGLAIGANLAESVGLGTDRGASSSIASAVRFARALTAAATPSPVDLTVTGTVPALRSTTQAPVTINLTIEAGPATDLVSLGRDMVECLDAYLSAIGRPMVSA